MKRVRIVCKRKDEKKVGNYVEIRLIFVEKNYEFFKTFSKTKSIFWIIIIIIITVF